METKNIKKVYTIPEIVCVVLDNDISLQLESEAPIGPGETNLSPEYLNNDPFKNNMA